jgi:hypothetical protein
MASITNAARDRPDQHAIPSHEPLTDPNHQTISSQQFGESVPQTVPPNRIEVLGENPPNVVDVPLSKLLFYHTLFLKQISYALNLLGLDFQSGLKVYTVL